MFYPYPIWFYPSASCATLREFIAELLCLNALSYVPADSYLLLAASVSVMLPCAGRLLARERLKVLFLLLLRRISAF